jgi:hypothetical protein
MKHAWQAQEVLVRILIAFEEEQPKKSNRKARVNKNP